VDIRLYQNNLSARLKIPTGARKNLDIKLANWIWDKEEFLIESLKGLFEAEGSFSIHQKLIHIILAFQTETPAY
jgi:hypothetical protein